MSAYRKLRNDEIVKGVMNSICTALGIPATAISEPTMYARVAEFKLSFKSKAYPLDRLVEAARPARVRQVPVRNAYGEEIQETWIDVDLQTDDRLDRACVSILWLGIFLLLAGFAGLVYPHPSVSAAASSSSRVFSRFV